MDSDEERLVLSMFRDFVNHFGTVSVDKLDEVAHSVGVDLPRDELIQLVAQFDVDNSGELSKEEFIAMIQAAPEQIEVITARLRERYLEEEARAAEEVATAAAARDKELRRMFRDFDLDGSGTISVDELDEVAQSVGVDLPRDELLQLVAQFDLDNSGELDEEEFVALIHGAHDQIGAITARLRERYLDEKALAAGAADNPFYSNENILAREKAKKSPKLRAAIKDVWDKVLAACGVLGSFIFHTEYETMSRKLYLAMKAGLPLPLPASLLTSPRPHPGPSNQRHPRRHSLPHP